MSLATTTAPAGVPEFHLGDRLAKALDYADMKNHDIAEVLDVGRNTVGNYIAGRTKPSRATLIVWAQATGVSIDWLAGDDYVCPSCGQHHEELKSRCFSESGQVRHLRRADDVPQHLSGDEDPNQPPLFALAS